MQLGWTGAVADEGAPLSGETLHGRLLPGMQRTDWGAQQLHTYAHSPSMQPEASNWTMMGPAAHGSVYAQPAASRRFFSESMEYTQEVRGRQIQVA